MTLHNIKAFVREMWLIIIRGVSSFQGLISYCERDILGECISVLISGVWIEGFHCTAVQIFPQ